MKVLFLDIDGVLNRRGTTELCGQFVGVDRALAKRFTAWLKNTDVKVVLSSTWRKHPDMFQHLYDAGIHWFDVTPSLGSRGMDINGWLANNPVTAYAVLDDLTGLPDQKTRWVLTDADIGLTDDNVAQLTTLFA